MELAVVRKAIAPESFMLRREHELVVVSKAESTCKLFNRIVADGLVEPRCFVSDAADNFSRRS